MDATSAPSSNTSDPIATTGTAEVQPDVTYPLAEASLTDAQVASAIDSINQLKSLLPPLPGLTGLQRRRYSKLGTKTEGFVNTAIEAATKDPGVLPQSISLEKLRSQDQLRRKLSLLQTHLADLTAKLDDSLLLSGNWLFGVGRSIYTMMKMPVAQTRMPDQQAELRKRFARKTKADQTAQAEQVPV